MKTVIAMMLAAAFLIARPALANDEAPKAAKSAKAAKTKKGDKKEGADQGAKKDEKKADKGGW